jgi:hypothetical protein
MSSFTDNERGSKEIRKFLPNYTMSCPTGRENLKCQIHTKDYNNLNINFISVSSNSLERSSAYNIYVNYVHILLMEKQYIFLVVSMEGIGCVAALMASWKVIFLVRWDACVKNGVLQGVKEKRNTLHTIKRRKTNWIGHTMHRICLLHHVNEKKIGEKIEVTGRQERRFKQLLGNLKERRGH